MSAKVAERALEPFFTTKDVGKGTGLGLSQVYGKLHQSGGAVRSESAPGIGTSVRLYLRRTEIQPRRAEELSAP
jgi:signal transduction histidine kinase